MNHLYFGDCLNVLKELKQEHPQPSKAWTWRMLMHRKRLIDTYGLGIKHN